MVIPKLENLVGFRLRNLQKMDKENDQNFLNTPAPPNTSFDSDVDTDSNSGSDFIIQGQWSNQLLEKIRDILNIR